MEVSNEQNKNGKGDVMLMIIALIAFAHFFFYMIAGLFQIYSLFRVLDYTLGLALYAIPLLASFAIQKKGIKTLVLILGIVSLVIFITNKFMYTLY